MNIARGFDGPERGASAMPIAVGGDERRMHVRAYNHWVSLLRGRSLPSVADLDPAGIADFGPHGVLIDFSQGEDPTIAYLGSLLREECALDEGVARMADVPSRSLLSRLTDHYLQIIANRAPVGFEAEFVGTRGHQTMYRGILMPFSSDGREIDFVYGVINWKELVGVDAQAELESEVAQALATPVPRAPTGPVWADGPSRDSIDDPPAIPLGDRLEAARGHAVAAQDAEDLAQASMDSALGAAHDFALATKHADDDYRALLSDAGISAYARPSSAVSQLVFGVGTPPPKLRRIAAMLDHAATYGVPEATLPHYIRAAGGVDAILA